MPRSAAAFRSVRCCYLDRRWAPSRKSCNRLARALRGNIKVVVANVGALSNLHLAVRTAPDVALVQELWASASDIRTKAKELGYVAAVAAGSCCLSAVLYRPGRSQQIHLPLVGEFSSRAAAAVVSLGGGCGCCFASIYGISSATVGQKEQLSEAIRLTMEEFGPSAAGRAASAATSRRRSRSSVW